MAAGPIGVHYLLRWPKPMPELCGERIGSKGVDVMDLLEFWCVAWISWSGIGGMVSVTWVTLTALVSILVVTDFGVHGDGDG